ncbi:MAG: PspC domain-containing protein [Bacteroidales bacterium]
MKKTVSINLNRTMFHIDEDAYEILKTYLNNIKQYIQNEQNADEIYTDIEARICELLYSKITHPNQVITITDIEEIIEIMGNPEEFGMSDEHNSSEYQKKTNHKRLYRDTQNRVLGGVCAGLSHYFNTDVVLIRIIVFCTIFFAGPLLYIVAWIIIPEAKTTSQRADMHGNYFDIEYIKQKVKEEINNVKSHYSKYEHDIKNSCKKKSVKTNNHTFPFFRGLQYILRAILFVSFIAGIGYILLHNNTFFLSNHNILSTFHNSISSLLDYIITSHAHKNYFLISLYCILCIPIILLFYGISTIIGVIKNKTPEHFVFLLWISATVLGAISIYHIYTNFSHKETITEQYNFAKDTTSPFIISPIKNSLHNETNNFQISLPNESYIYRTDTAWHVTHTPSYDIIHTDKDSLSIIVKATSRGKNQKRAQLYAKNIGATIEVTPKKISFPEEHILNTRNIWRNQHIHIHILLPAGVHYKIEKTIKNN